MDTLHVLDEGSGPAIAWIHGFPLSSRTFARQVGIPGVRHLALDLPGFGRSGPGAMESIDDYAVIVLSMLSERAIDRAVIAGVSMGGYVALAIARQRPEIVSGLILIDTRETPDSDQQRAGRLAQIDRVQKEGTAFLIEEMLPKMLTAGTRDAEDERLAIVREAMESASPAGTCQALRAMATRPDSAPVLRAFENPVLVVVGSRDELTPPSDASRMASMTKDSTLVEIPDAAHLSNVEQPEAFNEAVTRFLNRIR